MAERMGLAGLVLCVAALSACSSAREAEQARYAQQALVGMPAETLLSCAGVPERREAAGGDEFLTYTSARAGGSGSSIGLGVGGGGGNLGLGLGLGIPLGGGGSSSCAATFTVRQGRVAQLAYRQDSGDTAACYAIVENCLSRIPRQQ
ncbi:hypothetical protein HHL28_16375 [Aerophototrophica crusticola]|uniref:Lipoprotein n=1 Tax=Aerophototrophica crusticola TaxID=1709002 RepID=A0A858R2U2_9PROT|nr:hypothetical protein HHL28_16375 [Rhodospirillaceae bacterium B3]